MVALGALLTALPPAADEENCHRLYRLTDLSHAIEPGISVAATDALPAHCRVRGVVNRAIRFEVTLPHDWNGRLMFTAVGGNAGYIGDTTSLLARGFAMASTDTGHELEHGNDFLAQPEARLDHACRGVHLATLASKRVIAHCYGRDTQDAHPLDKAAFTVLDEASRTACDALDGVEDGVINDPRICETDVDALVCAEDQTEGCLTAEPRPRASSTATWSTRTATCCRPACRRGPNPRATGACMEVHIRRRGERQHFLTRQRPRELPRLKAPGCWAERWYPAGSATC